MEVKLAEMEAPNFVEKAHFRSFEMEKPEEETSSQDVNSLFQNKIKNNSESQNNQAEENNSEMEIVAEEVREDGLQIPTEKELTGGIPQTFGKLGDLNNAQQKNENANEDEEEFNRVTSIARGIAGGGGGSFGRLDKFEKSEQVGDYEIEVTDGKEAGELAGKLSFGENSFREEEAVSRGVGQGVFGADSFGNINNGKDKLEVSGVMADKDLLSSGQMSRPNSMQSGLMLR